MKSSSLRNCILTVLVVLWYGYSFSQMLPKSVPTQEQEQSKMKKAIQKGQSLPVPKLITNNITQFSGIIFSDDFEQGSGNWSFQNTLWQIGQPASGPYAAYSGSRCAATNLYGNYPDNLAAGLVSRSISLPSITSSKRGIGLTFYHWYQTESDYDYGSVWISSDNGQTWTKLHEYDGSQEYWTVEEIDLSDYAGQQIRLDFWFSADGSNNYAGWYIDDISIVQTEILSTSQIEIAIASNGQFTMGIPNGPVLLFGHPEPWSSATTIQIDGMEYWNYNREFWGNVIAPPVTSGLQNITIWEIANNIRLKQTLTIVQGSTSGNYDTGEIRYTVTNNDATAHSVGIRIMLDTMLGLNDGAPFRVPGTGAVTTDHEWYATAMPPYFQAFDDLDYPTVQSQGTLIGGNALEPDRFVATCWSYIKDTYWDYNIVPGRDFYWGDYGYDSAAGIYWFPVTLVPGESKDFVTYYGLGGIDIDLQPPLVVGLSAPRSLVFLNGVASGNPFSLSVYLSNSSPGVIQTAVGITTTLNLPSGLMLPTGETAIHNIPNMPIGTEQYTSYSIEALPSAVGEKTYSLTVTATNITTKTVQKDIYLFGINTVPVNNATVSSSLNTITAQFSGPMNAATITSSTFYVMDESNHTLNSSVNFNVSENKAILTLLENLLPNKQHKARLSSSIQSIDGTNLPYDVEWSFTTTMQPKDLQVLDANNKPILNKEFKIYKVNNNLTEEYKGSRTTNSEGKLSLDPLWFSLGDQMKLDRIVFTQQSQKPNHEIVDSIMYQIKIDNGSFDNDGNISYHTLTDDALQTIVLDHTTVMYNLIVSVEWDADQAYLDSLLLGYRLTSNYLYDVTDGQLYINKIVIYDNKELWKDADAQIFANNQQWPGADILQSGAIRLGGGIFGRGKYTYIPRVFYFNDLDAQRNFTYNLYPYNWRRKSIPDCPSVIYVPSRTLAHEFGHYGIGFRDEYETIHGLKIFSENNPPLYHYGFMDDPIKDDEQNSEMSCTAIQYFDLTHRITEQWADRGKKSCWDYFQWNYEGNYENIFAPIKIPIENMNLGPNNKLENLQFDVGAILTANSKIFNHDGEAYPSYEVRAHLTLYGPVPKADVTLYRNNPVKRIEQGKTDDDGYILVLGANNGDKIRLQAYLSRFDYWYNEEKIVGGSKLGGPQSISTGSSSENSLIVSTKVVAVKIKMVNEVNFQNQDQLEYSISFDRPLPEIPNLELYIDNHTTRILPFNATQNPTRYSLTLDELTKTGLLTILAKDDSLNSFFINQNFIIKDSLELNYSPVLFNFDGLCELAIDSINIDIKKLFILSSNFKPILNGSEINVEQGGAVHTIASFPNQANLSGTNILTIRYSDSDFHSKSESTLRIFKWDENSRQWQRIGGEVDTIRNEVTAEITSFGTYAAFTTKAGSTDEKLDNNNCYFYPNPFNPDQLTGRLVFGLSAAGTVKIKIYDVAMNSVATIEAGSFNSGSGFEVAWDGKNSNGQIVANGVYFYVIESSSGERAVGKVAVLR